MMEDMEDLIESLANDAAPVKPALHPFLAWTGWTGMAVAYVFVALLISGHRPDLASKLHSPLFLAEVSLLFAITCTTALSAVLLSFPDLYQRERIALLPLLAFAGFALVMFLAWQADNPPSPLPVHSYQCTLSITLVALMPTVWTFYFMRKFASTHARWAGAVAVLHAFSMGALWFRLYEQTDSIAHVLEWHYLPMLAIGIAGFLLGKAMLKW